MVLFQAPFSFASSGFMTMFGNGMSYELLIAPVALYGSIHIMPVRYIWAKFTKSFIMEMAPWQIPVLCDFFFVVCEVDVYATAI